MIAQTQYSDGFWWSKDGVRLHYRDYPGDPARPPIICIPGLTRNARDFAMLAARLSPQWRVLTLDLRGRGESGYAKDSMTYVPLTYVQDVEALLNQLAIERFVAVGTSLGGLVAMLIAASDPGRVAGAVLNDTGPVLETVGLDRIKGYVGKSGSYATWVHAARSLAEQHGHTHPAYGLTDWIAHAKRLFRVTPKGRIVADYDPRIAEPLRMPAGDFDMWGAFEALRGVPLLIVRGALSDVFSDATAAQMLVRLPGATLVTLADVGHAPTLDEANASAAIETMLGQVVL